jgi:predicted site-specific integrase-resolvase
MVSKDPNLVNLSEFARIHKVSVATVLRWIKDGHIPSVEVKTVRKMVPADAKAPTLRPGAKKGS